MQERFAYATDYAYMHAHAAKPSNWKVLDMLSTSGHGTLL